MHDSSLNQIGRNMIIIVLIILLSYIFTMDSVKYINKQLLFILLVFVALIIYKMINYNAYVKYTNDKINELKQLKQVDSFNNFGENVLTELDSANRFNTIRSREQENNSNIFNSKKILVT